MAKKKTSVKRPQAKKPKKKLLRKFIMHMTHQTYEEIGGGLVRVTNRDGKTGVFRWDGPWVEGDVRDANSNMLLFTGGPDVQPGFKFRWTVMPADIKRASGWPKDLEPALKKSGAL